MVCWAFYKSYTLFPHDPAVTLPGIYPKDLKIMSTKKPAHASLEQVYSSSSKPGNDQDALHRRWGNKRSVQAVGYYSVLERNEVPSREHPRRSLECTAGWRKPARPGHGHSPATSCVTAAPRRPRKAELWTERESRCPGLRSRAGPTGAAQSSLGPWAVTGTCQTPRMDRPRVDLRVRRGLASAHVSMWLRWLSTRG